MISLQKFAVLTVATFLLLPASGFAQGVGNTATTGPAAPSGDAAVSPSGNASAGSVTANERPSAGMGVNSGVLNNGTTGDTIGTGHGTPADGSTARR
jgi:hypothetical protein